MNSSSCWSKSQDIQERQMILMIRLTFHHMLRENKVEFVK